jgi:hypothetical protein
VFFIPFLLSTVKFLYYNVIISSIPKYCSYDCTAHHLSRVWKRFRASFQSLLSLYRSQDYPSPPIYNCFVIVSLSKLSNISCESSQFRNHTCSSLPNRVHSTAMFPFALVPFVLCKVIMLMNNYTFL